MKLTGLVSLCSAIALTGFYLAFLLNKKIRLLNALCNFFSDMGEMGKTGLWDIAEILARLSGKYKELSFIEDVLSLYEGGENLREIWEREIESFCPFYISSEIKGLLSSFSEVMGRSTREGFIKRCEDFSSSAQRLLIAEEKHYEKNRTVTMYSGVLAAAAIFFILI